MDAKWERGQKKLAYGPVGKRGKPDGGVEPVGSPEGKPEGNPVGGEKMPGEPETPMPASPGKAQRGNPLNREQTCEGGQRTRLQSNAGEGVAHAPGVVDVTPALSA
jgi:hypothetical protein